MKTVDRAVIVAAVVGVAVATLAGSLSTWTTGLIVGAAGFVLAYAGALWLLQPMARYVAFIQRLAEGDFDEEVPATRERPFAQVAQALEAMRLHLRTWMGQIARSAIEFEGSLQVLDLVHVMHFLRAGRRSGTLVLQRGGEMALQFWKDGEVVGALYGGEGGLEALKTPFGWERGSFKFSPRLDPTINLNARWEVLLLSAVRGVDNPKLWGRLVPKPSTVVRRSARADHMPVRQLLTHDEWAIWSALSGELSAEDVAQRLGEPTYKAWHALYCFSALGLIEAADGSASAGTIGAVAPSVPRSEPLRLPIQLPTPGAPGAARGPARGPAQGPPQGSDEGSDPRPIHGSSPADMPTARFSEDSSEGASEGAPEGAPERTVWRQGEPSLRQEESALRNKHPDLRQAAGGNVILLDHVRRRGR